MKSWIFQAIRDRFDLSKELKGGSDVGPGMRYGERTVMSAFVAKDTSFAGPYDHDRWQKFQITGAVGQELKVWDV